MRCEICNSEMPQGVIRCSVCGFNHFSVTEADDGGIKAMMREDFRRQKLGGIGIWLRTYNYIISGGSITEAEGDPVLLAQATDLEINKPRQCETEFCGIGAGEKAELTLLVGGEQKKEYPLSFEMPEKIDSIKVGIMMTDGLRVSLTVSGGNCTVATETIPLLEVV